MFYRVGPGSVQGRYRAPLPALSAGYDATCARIAALVVDADASRPVPACPGWRVGDLVAHLCATAGAGDETSMAAQLARWRAVAAVAGAAIDDGAHDLFVDAVVHEHDLRGALQKPGGRGAPEVRAAVTLQLEDLGRHLKRAGLGGLVIDAGGVAWTSHFARAGCTLRTDPWEAMRVLASRRTEAEVRALVVSGDVEPYLDALAAHRPLPTASLGERP